MLLRALQNSPNVGTEPNIYVMLVAASAIVVFFGFVVLLITRYKRCPSNKLMVIFGKVREGHHSFCVHGGGVFVWPLIQDYAFLDLEPMRVEIRLQGLQSLERARVDLIAVFTVAIGTDPGNMEAAAVRLLGLRNREIAQHAEDILRSQLEVLVGSLQIEVLDGPRGPLLERVHAALDPELGKLGLGLVNVNATSLEVGPAPA